LQHFWQKSNCRDIGQLQPIRLFLIADRGSEAFVKRELTEGSRLGDVKPAMFSRKYGWSTVFSGHFT
jgi:hypothetical protein